MNVGDKVEIIGGPYKSDHIIGGVGNTGVIVSITEEEGEETLYDVLPDVEPDTDWPFYIGELKVIV